MVTLLWTILSTFFITSSMSSTPSSLEADMLTMWYGHEAQQHACPLETIDGTNLGYDPDTNVVYYLVGDTACPSSYSMCPYYSKNGNVCLYVDGKLIEIAD